MTDRTRMIGDDAYAVISGPDQEPVYIDPYDVAAIIGPSVYRDRGEEHSTCNVYLSSGFHFTTALSVSEISEALVQAKEIRNKKYNEVIDG